MATKKNTKSPSVNKKEISTPKRKVCCACPSDKNEKTLSAFYRSYNPMHTDGYIPMCKECVQSSCYNEDEDEIDVEGLKNILRQIDRPYIEKILQSSIEQYNDTYAGKNVPKNNKKRIIGYYFKNIQTLRQYTAMSWVDGMEWEKKEEEKNKKMRHKTVSMPNQKNKDSKPQDEDDDIIYSLDDNSNFTVTQDIIKLFGSGYKKKEYKAMWDKYQFLKISYPDVTNLHVEALVTYIRFKVKEEFATALGDVAEAEKWSNAAVKASDKAKINPSQLSQNDLLGGLNSFSELLQAVEQAVDIIPILPQFRFRPNDAVDFNIWCMINYLRDLEGKPLCEYEDVYKFYDDRKQDYIDQYGDPYGIFTEDTTDSNRDKIKKFITLPDDYNTFEDIPSVGDDNE